MRRSGTPGCIGKRVAAAMERLDQCVALRGFDSNVAMMTCSTSASPTPAVEFDQCGYPGAKMSRIVVAAAIISDVRVRAGIRIVIEHASFTAPLPDAYQTWITVVAQHLNAAKQSAELLDEVAVDDTATLIVGSFTGIQLVSEVITGRADLIDRIHGMWSLVRTDLVAPQQFGRYRWTPPAARMRPRRCERTAGRNTA